MATIELGRSAPYPDCYDPKLLQAIPRELGRSALEKTGFIGFDLWTAYELSWLRPSGLPQVAIAEFRFAANSVNMVESKSFKYYLNSFNQTVLDSPEALATILERDLSACAGGLVLVNIKPEDQLNGCLIKPIPGTCLDALDLDVNTYSADAALLRLAAEADVQTDCALYSHLFRSNCPVTAQPDWATIWIEYSGPKMDEAGLLSYLVSYRQHQAFHENCVESIFNDLVLRCEPDNLRVYARFTRRGGLDINPYRSTPGWAERTLPFERCVRQ